MRLLPPLGKRAFRGSHLVMALLRTADELAPLLSKPRRLLAVFAHPDDEAYGCAGALQRAGADPDAAAVLLCVSRGEASSMGPQRGLTPEQVGQLREGRLEDVAEIVKLDGLLVPGLPDGRLARQDLDLLAAPIRAALEAFRPQVVVTHDARGVNGHADHIAVHWAVRRALSGIDGVRLAMIAYTPETCEAAKPRLLFPTREEDIDATLDLRGAEIDAKEACLRVHEALVTLREEPDGDLVSRPPVEHYDFLGERLSPRAEDLFARLGDRPRR